MCWARFKLATETGIEWAQNSLIYGTPILSVFCWASRSSKMECIEAYRIAKSWVNAACHEVKYETSRLGSCVTEIPCDSSEAIWKQAKESAWFSVDRGYEVMSYVPYFGVVCFAAGWFAGTFCGYHTRHPAPINLERNIVAPNVRFFQNPVDHPYVRMDDELELGVRHPRS
jgi:hypothetical protein